MKHYTKLFLTSIATLAILTACGNKTETKTNSKTDTAETSQSLQTSTAETVEFFATGDYEEGVDIQAGSYYVVLTDMQYATSDEAQEAYISIRIEDSSEENKLWETVKELGKPYRVSIEAGDKIKLDDSYSPTGWTVTFFTLDDYKEFKKSEKK